MAHFIVFEDLGCNFSLRGSIIKSWVILELTA